MGTDRDKPEQRCTPAQLHTAWKSCLQNSASRATAGTSLCLSAVLTSHLQADQPSALGPKVTTGPATWSVYQNVRAMFKPSLVVHCETTGECKKGDCSNQPYRVRDGELHKAIKQYISKESTRDRFNLVFSRHDGELLRLSPELQLYGRSIMWATGLALTLGLVRAGLRGGPPAVEGNAEAAYMSTRHMVTGMIRESLRLTFRLCPVIAIGLGTAQAVSVYRNKSTPFEYSAGIPLAFGLGTIHAGPKVMAANVLLGFLVGAIMAPVCWGLVVMTDNTQDRLHYQVVEKLIKQTREVNKKQEADMV